MKILLSKNAAQNHFIFHRLKFYKNLAKELIETPSATEIIVAEKIHIVESEEFILEEVSDPVQEMCLKKNESDGKDPHKNSYDLFLLLSFV